MTASLFNRLFILFIFCFSSRCLLAFSLDTIPNFPTKGLGNKWVELGIGGSFGNYDKSGFTSNSWSSFDGRITTQSVNFTGSYNYGLEKGWIGIGIKGSFGSVLFDGEIRNQSGFAFTTIGSYAVVEHKWIGFAAGFFMVSHQDESYFYKEDLFPILNIRFGKIRSFHFNIVRFDEFGMGTFPEPALSFGLNYGFNNPSGMRKIRIGVTEIDEKTAVTIGFRHPLSKAPLLFDGAIFYGHEQFIVNIGLRYRFDMSWK